MVRLLRMPNRLLPGFRGNSGDEIAGVEGELVGECMPVAVIQRLCDVHAVVFRDQVEEPDDRDMDEIPGHPVRTLIRENEALANLIKSALEPQTQAYAQDPAAGGDALAASLGFCMTSTSITAARKC